MAKSQKRGNRELRKPKAAMPKPQLVLAAQETSAVKMIVQSKGKH